MLTHHSVDKLQNVLAEQVFHYAVDKKKAAGRALGTLVEIVTFYTLRAWGLRDHIVIERSVPEFANPQIVHNVEFSLHPIRQIHVVDIESLDLPLTPAKIARVISDAPSSRKTTQLLSRDQMIRNACVLWEVDSRPVTAHFNKLDQNACSICICELYDSPFAIVECKRVGVEEGIKKGPQTIEKAKQGAYVARSVSSLQKVRKRTGEIEGVMERPDGTLHIRPYDELLGEVIGSSEHAIVDGVILTIGVVSNHGNWFTSGDHNKELKVLAQSYDWLLFLTDVGLSQFIDKLLLNPTEEYKPARAAFLASYSGERGKNRFTKVKIDVAADAALRHYFDTHEAEIEGWYNVISPAGNQITELRNDLRTIARKNWRRIKE